MESRQQAGNRSQEEALLIEVWDAIVADLMVREFGEELDRINWKELHGFVGEVSIKGVL